MHLDRHFGRSQKSTAEETSPVVRPHVGLFDRIVRLNPEWVERNFFESGSQTDDFD
jgi:hypothetical protein